MTTATPAADDSQKPIPSEAPAENAAEAPKEPTLTELRDQRCIPIAGKVLKLLFEENAFLVELPHIEALVIRGLEELFPKQAGQLLPQATRTTLKRVWDLVEASMQHNLNLMYAKLLGKDRDALQIGDIENVLKAAKADEATEAEDTNESTPENTTPEQ